MDSNALGDMLLKHVETRGCRIVPQSPTGSMCRYAQQHVAPQLSEGEIEQIYFRMLECHLHGIYVPSIEDAIEAATATEDPKAIRHGKSD